MVCFSSAASTNNHYLHLFWKSVELIDECTEGIHNCDANAECTDTEARYECECNAGYYGDGFDCLRKLYCQIKVTFLDHLLCYIRGTTYKTKSWRFQCCFCKLSVVCMSYLLFPIVLQHSQMSTSRKHTFDTNFAKRWIVCIQTYTVTS